MTPEKEIEMRLENMKVLLQDLIQTWKGTYELIQEVCKDYEKGRKQ